MLRCPPLNFVLSQDLFKDHRKHEGILLEKFVMLTSHISVESAVVSLDLMKNRFP